MNLFYMKFEIRHITVFAICLFAIGEFLSQQVVAEQPNVLWIVTDDQRHDSIQAFNRILYDRNHSALGYVESPNIDRLASMGTTFINTYCQAPGCAPSRASMHYGRYPFRSGVYEFEYHNNNAEHCRPTLPEQMAGLGYQTTRVGKLGVRIKHVNKKGQVRPHAIYQTEFDMKFLAKEGLGDWGKNWFNEFDGKKLDEPLKQVEFFITPEGKFEHTNPQVDAIPGHEGQSKRVDEKYDLIRHFNKKKPKKFGSGMAISGVSSRKAGKTRDGYFSSVFIDYLSNAGKKFDVGSKKFEGADSVKPLFCHIGYHFPHTPVLPPKDYRERFKKHQYKVPVFDEKELETMSAQNRKQVNQGFSDHYSDEQKQNIVRDYFAFCAYGDSLIGKAVNAFVDYSEKQKQEWMIVYVCGDHGFKLNEHGSLSKFSSWDIDTHNPIIVVSSDKKKFPAGMVIKDFTEFVDIKPTILAAGGAKLSDEKFEYLDGRDLAKTAAGAIPARDYIVGKCHAVTGPRAYIRTKEYVLSLQTRPDKIRGKNLDWATKATYKELDPALYHFATDPHETKNLAFDEQHKDVAMKLKDKLLNVVLGDNRVEVGWGQKADGTQLFHSNFEPGAHDGKLKVK